MTSSAPARPERGDLPLPLLTLDLPAYRGNRDALLAYARAHGAVLAPHVKTAMIPELAVDFVAAGGWAVTVADVRQAAVMAEAGIRRIMIANEVGGAHGARHFARLAAAHPGVEFFVFADSTEAVAALEGALAGHAPGRAVPVLVEVGSARAGARDLDAATKVIDALHEAGGRGHVRLAGVAAYEGAAAVADPAETLVRVDALLSLAAETLGVIRTRLPGARLIATAGGSLYFDRVAAILGVAAVADGGTDLVLRPGAILYGDHGIYEKGIAVMDARFGFASEGPGAGETFRPVLRVLAEVLSRPEPDLAIVGMGMRNVSYDAGLPMALAAFRDGVPLALDLSPVSVRKLNDQHAYVALGGVDLRVGDVLSYGISHPCTCLHLWRTVQGVDASGDIVETLTTRFG